MRTTRRTRHLLAAVVYCAVGCAWGQAATAPAAATVQPSSVLEPSCAAVSDQASEMDLKVAQAQSQRLTLEEQARLSNESVTLWTQAVRVCDGRPKERALRNLADSQKVMLGVAEQRGSGPRCEAAHRDAQALHDLANQAFADRRWMQAAVMYRKAESLWEVATERCLGSQQAQANTRREQAEVDAHNAEFCAPVFDSAREQSQKLKLSGASMTAAEKAEHSMVAETLWRDAITGCKGAALDTARNNAQLIARDRGTPWVRKELPKPVLAPVRVAPSPATGVPGTAVASHATAPTASGAAAGPFGILSKAPPPLSVSTPGRSTLFDSVPSARPVEPATAAGAATRAAVPIAVAAPTAQTLDAPSSGDIVVGDIRMVGQFVLDPTTRTYSGQGKAVWTNGDAYEGALRSGQPHGKGMFAWTNGQRFDGDWQQGQPQGQGTMAYVNGNTYTGTWHNGKEHGPGRMRTRSGETYSGQFNMGLMEGHGSYSWTNGQQFTGDWARDQPHGAGKLTFANGNVYDGTVVHGKPNGRGRMVFASGDIYEGQFTDGQPEGTGTFTWVAGTKYAGQWKNGLKEGPGELSWPDGSVWKGMFQGDRQVEP